MLQFYRVEPTARTSWRQAILMGANSRTYKFPLGAALMDLARSGQDAVPLIELATTYATYLVNRGGNYPQAPSSSDLSASDFLTVLGRERDESIANGTPTEALVDASVRSIPGMVMDKFHNLRGQGEVAHRFYEIEGRGPKRIVRLTPELRAVAADGSLLDDELDSRWRIVEASFDAQIGRGLVGAGVDIDTDTGEVLTPGKRVSLTSVRPLVIGFQHGRCFYCHEPLGDLYGSNIHVDHVFAFSWMNTGSWRGRPDLNGIWNLVLSHGPCNLAKMTKSPSSMEIERLIARNDAIAESPKPVSRTLELSMGGAKTAAQRRQYITNVIQWTTDG